MKIKTVFGPPFYFFCCFLIGVAHNACERADLSKTKTLLVTGCGTIGLFVVAERVLYLPRYMTR